MAGELGLDVTLAKRAGLLHDIGKALDHEREGTHVDIGIEVLRKYKESETVINGMAASTVFISSASAGHTSRQALQPMHFSSSSVQLSISAEMASLGHSFAHALQ